MAINAFLRFFGTRSPPGFHQREGVAACKWKSRQQAATTLHFRHCVQIRHCVEVSTGAVGIGEQARTGIEVLDTKQKRQVSLFVDSLLDWNQVRPPTNARGFFCVSASLEIEVYEKTSHLNA